MIPIAKPFFTNEEIFAVQDAIRSGWVTQGPKVKSFEEDFKTFVQAPFACATSNCTTALHLALLAVGVKPGDVVITVSHSFIATANCVRHCGAEPVFIDIDPDTCNISFLELERCINEQCVQRQGDLYYRDVMKLANNDSPLKIFNQDLKLVSQLGRVSAVMVVHQLGMPCDLAEILSVAKKYQLPVIEDAAYALGSEISFDGGASFENIGKPHGDVACFSFHPRKILVTGEGGMVTCRDQGIDQRIRLLRHQGMGMSDLERHRSHEVVFERYLLTGYNDRMSDIQAAMGIEQLKKMPMMLERRKRIAQQYEQGLKDISWIQLFKESSDVKYNWAAYPVKVLDGAPKTRDNMMQYLLDQGISTRPGVMNAHGEPPYQNFSWALPCSEEARNSIMLLPCFHELTDDQIDLIIRMLRNV